MKNCEHPPERLVPFGASTGVVDLCLLPTAVPVVSWCAVCGCLMTADSEAVQPAGAVLPCDIVQFMEERNTRLSELATKVTDVTDDMRKLNEAMTLMKACQVVNEALEKREWLTREDHRTFRDGPPSNALSPTNQHAMHWMVILEEFGWVDLPPVVQ